ncbi:MAG: polysaccharide deacetylase family protein [bacterium]|nr:polysaccharide deacetylase family protein [bacterium]
MMLFTTSWDDGHKLDLRLAELLKKYNIAGTFYIPKKYLSECLTEKEIIHLSKSFEIGAHTINHVVAPSYDEIYQSKIWLEKLINKEIKMFCYPRGKYNPQIKNNVIKAGFSGARTTADFSLGIKDPLEMPTTVHVYPVPHRRAFEFGISLWNLRSWLSMTLQAFDMFLKRGGIFHLWGHSWEIEKFDLWDDLESFFKHVNSCKNIVYVSNGDLV